MRRISESFCRLSEQIYRRTLDWKSEMAALVTALGVAGLECHGIDALATCNNWPGELPDDRSAPIAHYTQPVRDRAGTVVWSKRTYTPQTLAHPWGRPAHPSTAVARTDRRALAVLHDFIDSQERGESARDTIDFAVEWSV